MTKTFPTAGIMTAGTAAKKPWNRALLAQLRDEFRALALGEAADRLRRRDPALIEDAVGLHPAVLGNRHQHVDDLRRLDVLGGIHQQGLDLDLVGLEIALQLSALGADVVRPAKSFHPLVQ